MADPDSPVLSFTMMDLMDVDVSWWRMVVDSPADEAGIRPGDALRTWTTRPALRARHAPGAGASQVGEAVAWSRSLGKELPIRLDLQLACAVTLMSGLKQMEQPQG